MTDIIVVYLVAIWKIFISIFLMMLKAYATVIFFFKHIKTSDKTKLIKSITLTIKNVKNEEMLMAVVVIMLMIVGLMIIIIKIVK